MSSLESKAQSDEKRPRHYAAEIAAMKSLEQRRAAIEAVPAEWRELVKAHLMIRAEWRSRGANKT